MPVFEWLKRCDQMNPGLTFGQYQKQIIPLHSPMLQAHHCRAFLRLVNNKKSHTTLSFSSNRLSSVCLIASNLPFGFVRASSQPSAQNGVLLHHLLHFSLRAVFSRNVGKKKVQDRYNRSS